MNKFVYACFGKEGIKKVTFDEYLKANEVDPGVACICDYELCECSCADVCPLGKTGIEDRCKLYYCPLQGCDNALTPKW
jgi:hypothetical protein